MTVGCTQTEIAQFQIDEILLKLTTLQQVSRKQQRNVVQQRGRLLKSASKETTDEETPEADRANFMERSMLTDAIALLSRSMETEFAGSQEKEVQTESPVLEDAQCFTDRVEVFSHSTQTTETDVFSRVVQTEVSFFLFSRNAL